MVVEYDREMRYLLETGDTSRIDAIAREDALNDRLNAADILDRAGGCVWDYDHRGLYTQDVSPFGEAKWKVLATVDRGGTVFCEDGERPEFAFPGPYDAIYIVQEIFGRLWVIDYCPVDDCPDEYLD